MDIAAIGIVYTEQLQLKWDHVYFVTISKHHFKFWLVIGSIFGNKIMLCDAKRLEVGI